MAPALRASLLALLVVPSIAAAQLTFDLRAGYALPFGDAYDLSGQGTFSQKEFVKGMVPVQIGAAWRFTPEVSAGLYYSYGFGMKGSKLDDLCGTPGASCNEPVVQRFGAAFTYRLDAMAGIAPWCSLGAGMELAHFKVKDSAVLYPMGVPQADLEGSFRGWNANAALGADYRIGRALALGPFVQLDLAQYTVQHVTLQGETVAGGGIDSPKMHEWLTFGLKGTFDL
ncbi:MAG TPA: autotransporter outer membrane beta-barrel domain-containing protein [Anaeromyxobacteraceae bacterium]|nr:autotransporter outer membrane beta-barrel domain-containing protein [Anaeromyxobacteraceae bacterium]